jgi:hypothetical protein
MTIENILELLTLLPMTRVKINEYSNGYLSCVADTGRKGIKDIPLSITMRDVTSITVSDNTIVLEYNND